MNNNNLQQQKGEITIKDVFENTQEILGAIGVFSDKMDRKFEQVDKRFDAVGERFDRLETQIYEIKVDLVKVKTELKRIRQVEIEDTGALTSNYFDLEKRIKTLEQRIRQLEMARA